MKLCNFFAQLGISFRTYFEHLFSKIHDSLHKNKAISFCRQHFNPLRWSKRTTRIVAAAFYLIALPIYFFIGFQPISSADAMNYPTLEIPSINLATPVEPLTLNDHKLDTPALIAGSYSQNQNKTLLIGHSSSVFKKLADVELNQILTYNDQEFIITKIETLAKEDISMRTVLAAATQPTIIIMTCAGEPLPNQDATHRLLITAISI